ADGDGVDVLLADPADSVEYVHFFIADLVGVKGYRSFHGDHTHELEDMVLYHVAQRSGLFVITAPTLYAHGLGGGDLDVLDIVAVPDRLEKGIGEAQGKDILNRLLTEGVGDAINLFFFEHGHEQL